MNGIPRASSTTPRHTSSTTTGMSRLQAAGAGLGAAAQFLLPDATRIVIFAMENGSLRVLHTNKPGNESRDELAALAKAFTSERDAAVQRGLQLDGRRFEVHRHHPPLVYGRECRKVDVEVEESTGIAACCVKHSVAGSPCYAVITYELPHTSARMVTLLQDFCKRHLQA